jgi:uncharacterized protein YqjF (DUF2071 family)
VEHFSVKVETAAFFRKGKGAGEIPVSPSFSPADSARARMEAGWGDPLLFADWERALFLHYAVDAAELQKAVPFELDLWGAGQAFITLVAFTMREMRPSFGGAWAARLVSPIASHEFLNARTYVRYGDEPGIFFMREWLPNALARCVGPAAFGLPYRLGTINYRHRHESGELAGEVCARSGDGRLSYHATTEAVTEAVTEAHAARRDFLLERYTAFTSAFGLRRKFRVWHEPWRAAALDVQVEDDSILDLVPGCANARCAGAHYSEGVAGVWMGRPRLA